MRDITEIHNSISSKLQAGTARYSLAFVFTGEIGEMRLRQTRLNEARWHLMCSLPFGYCLRIAALWRVDSLDRDNLAAAHEENRLKGNGFTL
jgi:hypothetical protein